MDDLYMKLISTPKMLLTVEEASNFFGLPTNLFEMDVFLYPLENPQNPFKKYIQVTSLIFGLERRN